MSVLIGLATSAFVVLQIYEHKFENSQYSKYWISTKFDQTAWAWHRAIALKNSKNQGPNIIISGSSAAQYAFGSENKTQKLYFELSQTKNSGTEFYFLTSWVQLEAQRNLLLNSINGTNKTVVYLGVTDLALGINDNALALRFYDPPGFHECDRHEFVFYSNQYWTCLNPALQFYVRRFPYFLKNLVTETNIEILDPSDTDEYHVETTRKRNRIKADAQTADDISNIPQNRSAKLLSLEQTVQKLKTKTNVKVVLMRLPLHPELADRKSSSVYLNQVQTVFNDFADKHAVGFLDLNKSVRFTSADFQGDYWHIRNESTRTILRQVLAQDITERIHKLK